MDLPHHLRQPHHLGQPQFLKDGIHIGGLGLRIGMGNVTHMHHHVGLQHFLQGGAEGGHQFVRKVGDEPHRIGQDDLAPRRQNQGAHGGVQGGEQLVLRDNGAVG